MKGQEEGKECERDKKKIKEGQVELKQEWT